jgi:hypothetical protein
VVQFSYWQQCLLWLLLGSVRQADSSARQSALIQGMTSEVLQWSGIDWKVDAVIC